MKKTDLHPLVKQLQFTRSEFKRALKGVTDQEASKRFMPMNCISWNVGHLAWQEQSYFLHRAQGQMILPEIDKLFAYGAPASTPKLSDMIQAWETITKATDPWLATLTSKKLSEYVINKYGKPSQRIYGAMLQRVIYHYWYHTGENMAIRQMLGHTGLPQFVGNIDDKAPYTSENK
ncbi:MAG TPA: DinB family protein [Anaerolineae bacterium]|nr:DinB family protein [Anaerolineae bacterium]